MLIDVRTEEEYEKGHHEESVNIPLDKMTNYQFDFPLDEKIVLYCFSGGRAGVAKHFLKGKGFTNVSLLNDTGAY
ncbi:MAG: rhodanese-like domain-containing protein [Candidatus Nomurabacteria bacterium]